MHEEYRGNLVLAMDGYWILSLGPFTECGLKWIYILRLEQHNAGTVLDIIHNQDSL